VVITDFHMPEMDGKEVVTRILNSEKTSHIPIIILTSIGQNSETIGLAKLENVYAISKPVRQSQLFNAIITAFDKLDSTKPDIKQEVKQEDKVQIILDKISALKAKTGILLVEDNLVNQAVASSIIEMTGLAIDIAGDGQKAIEALQGKEYALVFMDVKMPNMDGLTATRIIRNDLKLNSMPIIAMTAHAMKGDREKCLEAGMNDYLSKPIIPEDLYKMIYQWLKKSEVLVKEKVYN